MKYREAGEKLMIHVILLVIPCIRNLFIHDMLDDDIRDTRLNLIEHARNTLNLGILYLSQNRYLKKS